MAKITLINPSMKPEDLAGPAANEDAPVHALPPLGLLSIGGALRYCGHEVEIIDAAAEKNSNGKLLSNNDVVKRVQKNGADYIGVTSTIVSISSANNLAYKLRNAEGINSDVPIIFGGHQISAVFGKGFYHKILQQMTEERRNNIFKRFSGMSFGIVGEGEMAMTEIIYKLEKGEDISGFPGLVYQQNGNFKINKTDFIGAKDLFGVVQRTKPFKSLDSFGLEAKGFIFPAYDLLKNPTKNYSASPMTCDPSRPSISVIFSRGCPGECTFCDRSTHGRRLRTHSPEYVVEMLKWLEKRFGYKDFYVTDDQGIGKPFFMDKFCDILEKENKGDGYYQFALVGRAKPLFQNQLGRMRESGAHQIAFGCESANNEILNFHKKHINLEEMIKGIKGVQEVGLDVKGLFMAGSPGETTRTLENTEKFKTEQGLKYISNSVVTPLPGSELYNLCIENLNQINYNGTLYLGNDLGIWLEDPDDWSRMTLWKPVWVPRSLVDELGSPLRAKEIIEQFVHRKPIK